MRGWETCEAMRIGQPGLCKNYTCHFRTCVENFDDTFRFGFALRCGWSEVTTNRRGISLPVLLLFHFRPQTSIFTPIGSQHSGMHTARGTQPTAPQSHSPKAPEDPQPHSPTAPQSHSPTLPQPHTPAAPQPHSPTAPQPHSPTVPQPHSPI